MDLNHRLHDIRCLPIQASGPPERPHRHEVSSEEETVCAESELF